MRVRVTIGDIQGFKERGEKLSRSALGISWPVSEYKGKLYWLEGVNRYNVAPRMRSHTIFSGQVRYMKLLADAPSIAIVPLDCTSFQFPLRRARRPCRS